MTLRGILAARKNVLFAFRWSGAEFQPKSASMAVILARCAALFPEFLDEHVKFGNRFGNMRNEELHTGGLPFENVATKDWLPDFFAVCKQQLAVQGRRGRSLSKERRCAVPAERCDGKVDEICRRDTCSRRRYHEEEWLEGRARGQQLCANRRG